MAKRVGIYARVSTRNGQTTENQLLELRAVAERNGWKVVEVFTDDGVSGAKGREQRPGLDEMLKGVARKEFDVVAAWSVDRLGRSLQDLIATLNELKAKDVDEVFHDPSSIPSGLRKGRAYFEGGQWPEARAELAELAGSDAAWLERMLGGFIA